MLGKMLFLQLHKLNLIFPMEYAIHKRPKKSSIKILPMQVITMGSDCRQILYNALVGLVISMQTHYMSSSLGSSLWRIQSRSFSWQKDWCVHWPILCVLVREVWRVDLFKLTTEQILKTFKVWVCSSCIRAFNPNVVELHLLDNHISECNTPYVPWFNRHWQHRKEHD